MRLQILGFGKLGPAFKMSFESFRRLENTFLLKKMLLEGAKTSKTTPLEGRRLTAKAWTLKPLRFEASKGLLPRFGPQTAYFVVKS